MAYTSFSPSGFAETLSQIAAFLSSDMGWSASYDSGAEQATIVPKANEATFVLGYYYDDEYTGNWITCQVSKGGNVFTANVNMMPAVSKVWIFAGSTPEPWCHVVIRSAPGDYHHLYFGYLERYGAWSCGAVADGTLWDSSYRYRESAFHVHNHMLFSGESYWAFSTAAEKMGGVLLEGVNVSKGIARFARATGSYSISSYPDDASAYAAAYGGFKDHANGGLVSQGTPLHNGITPMTPILLTADFDLNGNRTPIGSPPGVRMVNITDYNPEDVVTFGADQYQLFPLANKTRPLNLYDDLPTGVIGGSSWMGVAVKRV